MNTCSYSFDSKEWENKHGIEIEDQWSWDCPYEQYNARYDRCVFHLSQPEREKSNISRTELKDCLIEQVLRGEENTLHGAAFDDLPLDFLSLRGILDAPINLRANSFERVSLANSQVDTAILFDYSLFEELNLSHAVFRHALGLQRVEISGPFSARMANLDRIYGARMVAEECDFSDATITRAAFHEAHFNEFQCPHANLSVILDGATFHEEFDVSNATFKKFVDCRGATFKCSCHIYKAEFEDNLRMGESTFENDFKIENSTLGGIGLTHAEIFGDLQISKSSMDKLVLDKSTIDGEIWIGGSFEDTIRLNGTECDDDITFSSIYAGYVDINDIKANMIYISPEQVSELHLKSSIISVFHISNGGFGSVGLSDSFVGRFSVTGTNIDSLLFVRVQIDGEWTKNQIGESRFVNTDIGRISWRGVPVYQETMVVFSGGSVDQGSLRQPEIGSFHYIFKSAEIGEVKFYDEEGVSLEYTHFISPKFDQFPFPDYTEELSPNWQLSLGSKLELPEIEPEDNSLDEYQTYQSARTSAERSNQDNVRAKFYKNEMHSRERLLWTRCMRSRLAPRPVVVY